MTSYVTKLAHSPVRLTERDVPRSSIIYWRLLDELGLRRYSLHFEVLTLDSARTWIIAAEGPTVLGVCGFARRETAGRVRHDAYGTWVRAPFRRTGIARKLWHRALEGLPDGAGVSVTTCSRVGARLALSLARGNAQFDWSVF